jgi:hypothetical protein
MSRSSTADERIGGVESKRLSLALRERVFSSEARRWCFHLLEGFSILYFREFRIEFAFTTPVA